MLIVVLHVIWEEQFMQLKWNLFWTVFHKNSISRNIQVVQPRLIILILAIAERISTWQSYLTHMHTQKHLHFFKTD